MGRFSALLFSLLLAAALFGCENGSGPSTPGIPSVSGGVDLNAEYGGLTFEDEEPAFGEPALFANEILAEDSPFEDEFARNFDVARLRSREGTRVFMLRIKWGRLLPPRDGESTACRNYDALDWSGSLSVRRGAIILKRTILFEPGDYIHERQDMRLLEWTSTTAGSLTPPTRPHYDGIVVEIIDPIMPDSVDCGGGYGNGDYGRDCPPNQVTFTTPHYTRVLTMDELISISELVYVYRCYIGVSFDGFLRPDAPCPQGFLSGIWEPISPETTSPPPPDSTYNAIAMAGEGREVRGHFYGNWIQAGGALAGHLRGVYGINSAGRQVFFGKYIDLSGNFKGILKGTYGSMSYAPYGETAGYFEGEWINEHRTLNGHLKGHWATGLAGPGIFHGRWNTDCPDQPYVP